MPDESRKQSLIVELAAARTEMSAHAMSVRRGLSVVERVKRGVRQRPALWFGGAVMLGLMLSKMARPKPKVVKVPVFRGYKADKTEKAGKAAVALTVLKFALDFARPALMKWVKSRLVSDHRRH